MSFDSKSITQVEDTVIDAINNNASIDYLGMDCKRLDGEFLTTPNDLIDKLPFMFVDVPKLEVEDKVSAAGKTIHSWHDNSLFVYVGSNVKKTVGGVIGVDTLVSDAYTTIKALRFNTKSAILIHAKQYAKFRPMTDSIDLFLVWEMKFKIQYLQRS